MGQSTLKFSWAKDLPTQAAHTTTHLAFCIVASVILVAFSVFSFAGGCIERALWRASLQVLEYGQ